MSFVVILGIIGSFLASSLKFSTVFLFGATGEIINQKSGHLNMGTPGIMYFGAIGGILGEMLYVFNVPADQLDHLNPVLIVLMPVIFAAIFGAIGGAIFSFFTVTLHCNQNVIGLTLTTFAVGVAHMAIAEIAKLPYFPRLSKAGLAMQSAFPALKGSILFEQSWFTYLGIAVAIVAAIVITKTRIGLNLRAVGENAAAADSAGINVNAYRYLATIIGGAIAGIGGAFFELDQCKGMFSAADGVDSFGWLALCIVIFSMWKPLIAIGASYLFACLSVLPDFLPPLIGCPGWASELLRMIPYIATLVVLIIVSLFNSKKNQPPANLGLSYFREDR